MSGLRIWTSEDDALLRNLAASGESTTAIAKRLERSTAAVRQTGSQTRDQVGRIAKGIGSRSLGRRRRGNDDSTASGMDQSRVHQLRMLAKRKVSADSIAKLLGRYVGSVRTKALELRLILSKKVKAKK